MRWRASWALTGVSLAALAGWWIASRPTALRADAELPTVPVQNALLGVDARVDELTALRTLSWPAVVPTAEALLRDAVARDRVLADTAGWAGAPLAALRGLLRSARGEAEAALAEFARVGANEMPLELLYAPFRLASELRPEAPNPYAPRLLQATREGRLTPLLAARMQAFAGDAPRAVQEYLRTDPAEWTRHDLRLLAVFLAHDGHRGAVAALLQAAWRGGRLDEPLRPAVLAVLRGAATHERATPAALVNLLNDDEAARGWFLDAVQTQADARAMFLARRDGELLATHATREVTAASNELVLLLTLSGARHRDRAAFARWSAELGRRFPEPEVQKWLPTLWPRAES